ncbi:MAG: UDP-N-acetylmuramate dehydrogenase, partial [Clostridia bacterium]|nr:UDP-N-acetylmuramate dehydrogenase [Clostridia bacterium]
IPSTVGGAVVNSLGAFDTNFSDFVEYVECYHKNDLTKKLRLSNEECKFGYRTSLFKKGDYIITRVKLRLFEDDKTLIQQRIQEAIKKKKFTQPLDYPSAGSVFKRGNIIPAKVIDELGLKGTKIGGAEISTKHAGFIINTNSATSKDVKELISLIQEKVKTATNEQLETEIEFVEY